MSDDTAWLLRADAELPTAIELQRLASKLEAAGDLERAATALDRAYSVDPGDGSVARDRARVLDALSVRGRGFVWRYVPAGPFWMGTEEGEPDEGPVHAVELGAFWMADVPVTWALYCAQQGWSPPPMGMPVDRDRVDRENRFDLSEQRKIRLQYCETSTTAAGDWHAHAPGQVWQSQGREVTAQELFGEPPREDPGLPWAYDHKPVVAVSWGDANALARCFVEEGTTVRLPTEAEWEKAARGGLRGARYPWGDIDPSPTIADYDGFDRFAIQPPRRYPPNGYGLHGMSGGVWEWTADWYDAGAYTEATRSNPTGPATGQQRVLRGGSWSDCATVLRVSYRNARPVEGRGGWALCPNIGVRLVRVRG